MINLEKVSQSLIFKPKSNSPDETGVRPEEATKGIFLFRLNLRLNVLLHVFPSGLLLSHNANKKVLWSTGQDQKGHSRYDQVLKLRSFQELWAVSVLPGGTNRGAASKRAKTSPRTVNFLPFESTSFLLSCYVAFKYHQILKEESLMGTQSNGLVSVHISKSRDWVRSPDSGFTPAQAGTR